MRTMQDQTEIDISQLVQDTRRDPKHFGTLYCLYLNRVYAYILGLVRNHQDAEDLCSETFITALKSLNQLRDPNRFVSWLFSIARNKCMDYFRSSVRNNQRLVREDVVFEELIEPQNGLQDKKFLVQELLKKLNQDEKELILWKYFAELTFGEIAEILNVPVSTVKSRIYRILERMSASLED